MSDSALRDLVLKRLDADTTPEDEWSALVLAALDGEAELTKLLDEAGDKHKSELQPKTAEATTQDPGKPRIAFLKSITVEGFRGIGQEAKLDLTPGPGLTLVVGRNGSGKSSFAEALELLLTGDTYRWAQRTKVWRDGWRNLHHPKARVAADFALEGEKGACTVAREWAEGPDLGAATTWAQVHGKPRAGKEALGWETPLAAYRPFLSYNELGSMLDEGPSKLYDALSKVLGLDDLVDAQTALQQARSARESAQKDADKDRKQLLAQLEPLSDERATHAKEALARKDWGIDDLEAILAGSQGESAKDAALEILQRLSVLPSPDGKAIAACAEALTHAAQRQAQAGQTVAGRSDDLASLLDHAIRFHKAHGNGDCPVCGRKDALDEGWHEAKAKEAESLRHAAQEASEARQATKARIAEARRLLAIDQELLRKADAAGLEEPAAKVLALAERALPGTGEDTPQAATALAAAIEKESGELVIQLGQLRQAAKKAVEARQDAWRPHATALIEWLPKARKATKAAESLPNLKAAEKWMKVAANAIQNERFAPIAEHAVRIWDQLKLQSNVTLAEIQLKGDGANKARKVELKVTVDGQEGAALGVMSQGELHSLALSLFVPRATLPESPFRFVVIDDPVQSMDPARVDGLAKVLQAASKDRQVVVFTHDDRLPEAVRRLGIKATVIEVTRKEGSIVAPRPSKDPVSRYLKDAFTLAKTNDLPQEVAKRVVPGLCRQAIEAACMEAIRRRRIGRGEPHVDVEDLLAGITGTKSLAALALFDDKDRAGEVLQRLNKENKSSADTFRAVNEGAHEAMNGDVLAVVRNAEKLARWMQALA